MYQGIKADMVVVEPPCKGCEEKLLDALVEMALRMIVYVSCNPSTLARDLKYLCIKGKYVAVEAQPVDMFSWTVHLSLFITRISGCIISACKSMMKLRT